MQSSLQSVSLDSGRKLENPQETTEHGESMQTPDTRIKPSILGKAVVVVQIITVF